MALHSSHKEHTAFYSDAQMNIIDSIIAALLLTLVCLNWSRGDMYHNKKSAFETQQIIDATDAPVAMAAGPAAPAIGRVLLKWAGRLWTAIEVAEFVKERNPEKEKAEHTSGREATERIMAQREQYLRTEGAEALVSSAYQGDMESVRNLLRAGVDINAENENGSTALMWAAHQGHSRVVEVLLDKGANPNHASHNGFTALMWAAQSGHIAAVRLLIANGANVKAATESGTTALWWSLTGENIEIARLLIEKGANVEATIQTDLENRELMRVGTTVLMKAAYSGQTDFLKLLLNHGANVHARRRDGETALSLAMRMEQSEAANALRMWAEKDCACR